MIEIDKVRRFFDSLAPTWDAMDQTDPAVLRYIVREAGTRPGSRVLDVATGTGILFPYYLEAGAETITGLDVSPEMCRLAKEKTSDSRVRVYCADACTWQTTDRFDVILIHNAFPHFADPAALLHHLSSLLAPGGRLTVAHSFSRTVINGHHSGTASPVSRGLEEAETVAAWMERDLKADKIEDNDRLYLVSAYL